MNSLTSVKQISVLAPAATCERLDSEPVALRPPLKWAGGKRWQLPYLRPLWQMHSYRRLVEPFAGGLAVALGLRPTSAILNDINPHVINFYRWLKRGLRIEIRMLNSRATYDRSRERFNSLVRRELHTGSEAAELFYYLNRTGYNGLCRFNRLGEYNVPFGKHKSIEYMDDFSEYAAAFKTWTFLSGDFESIPVEAGDFIYADPPYDVDFTSYAKDGFDWEDQLRTAQWLANHPGPVVLSNQATPRIVRLYRNLGFKLKFLNAPRMISCNGDRTPAREVLAIKNF
jgi:DNA adenine methylase